MKSYLTLHGRLLLTTIGVVLLLSLILVALCFGIGYAKLAAHLRQSDQEVLEKLSKVVSIPYVKQDYALIVDIIDGEMRSGNYDFIWLTDEAGIIIICNDPGQTRLPIPTRFTSNPLFLEQTAPEGFRIALLPNNKIISNIGSVTVIATGFSVLFLLAIFCWLANRLARMVSEPIAQAAAASARLASGDFCIDIPSSPIAEINNLSETLIRTGKQLFSLTESLKSERNRLKESEEKFRRLIERLPDTYFFFSCSPVGRFTYLSPSVANILGFEGTADLLGFEHILTSDSLNSDGQKALELTLHGKKQNAFPLEVTHRDGTVRILEILAIPLFDSQEQVILVEGIARDITAQNQAERQLIRAQKMELVGTLAGGIAHDFNNVLGGIVGTLSILKYIQSQGQSIPLSEMDGYLATMERAGQNAMDLVNQLLSLSRPQETHFEWIDLNVALKNILLICGHSLDKSIEIRTHPHGIRALTLADPFQIEQVLLNLVVNAAHAMTIMRPHSEPWGGLLEITIQPSPPGFRAFSNQTGQADQPYWCVSVSDSGVGMDAATIAKIFDPFFTTKAKEKGTGLGLAMVDSIVRQNRGFIDVTSTPGKGTTMRVFLPQTADEGTNVDRGELEDTLPQGSGLVLVVDDDPTMRDIARVILENCGYQVVTAEDGVRCLQLFKERKEEIVAVLLDLVMPHQTGREVFLELRSVKADVRVLLASGFKLDSRVEELLSLGIRDFIQKPFTVHSLSRKMAAVVGAGAFSAHDTPPAI